MLLLELSLSSFLKPNTLAILQSALVPVSNNKTKSLVSFVILVKNVSLLFKTTVQAPVEVAFNLLVSSAPNEENE